MVFQGHDVQIILDGTPYSNETVGCANSITIDDESNTEGKYGINEGRTPDHFKRGNREISGSMDKAWVDSTYVSEVESTGTDKKFNLYFHMDDGTDTNGVKVEGVVFESVSYEGDSEGIVEASISFLGTDIAYNYTLP